MATQIVMDHTGDTRHKFDAKDAKSLLKAEERFKELTLVGFTAAVRTDGDQNQVACEFRTTLPRFERRFACSSSAINPIGRGP
jgi:hypothetical protein